MNIYDGRLSFYQWDTNQKVKHTGLKIGEELHWSNIKQPEALITAAYDLDGTIVADVPNILLQNSSPITVYRVITDDNGRYTREDFQFTVEQRPKPSDYVYTETEVKNYNALESRIKQLEKNGGSGVDLSDYYTKEETDKEIAEAVVNAGGGSVDLDNYYTKTETDTAIEEALANAGGGSGSTWRKIRTVTIPDDITADTSGVAFAAKDGGGYTFAFDTDENGDIFSCNELLVYSKNAGTPATLGEAVLSFDHSTPAYSVTRNQTLAGTSLNSKRGYGVSRFERIGETNGFNYCSTFGGGANNTIFTSGKPQVGVSTAITKINAFISNAATYGFLPNSEFDFYGR